MVVRALALDSVNADRSDAEGIDEVNLWVQADAAWTRWKSALSPPQRTFLWIWRGGAVKTRSRRWFHSRQGGFHHVRCACGAAVSSARHLFTDCPSLQALHDSLRAKHGLPPGWFAAQPRITAKSSWIAVNAGATVRRPRSALPLPNSQLLSPVLLTRLPCRSLASSPKLSPTAAGCAFVLAWPNFFGPPMP